MVAQALQPAQADGAGFIELRAYTLAPAGHKPYVALSESTGNLRCTVLPFLGAFTVDSGDDINTIYHAYYYPSFAHRDAARAAGPANAEWAAYVAQGRTHTREQRSSILAVPHGRPAPGVQAALAACRARAEGSTGDPAAAPHGPAAYVLARYSLPAGAAERLLGACDLTGSATASPSTAEGARADAPASTSSPAEPVFVGRTTMGAEVGSMVELWRFDSAADALAAIAAGAGGAIGAWRRAALAASGQPDVAAERESAALLRPTKWSNWQ